MGEVKRRNRGAPHHNMPQTGMAPDIIFFEQLVRREMKKVAREPRQKSRVRTA